ncbi:23 kDa integral membrane protein-like [Maniola hyperantus]|uniref:23 kDa integral membrane protein-like n=1 Tax=Aphantopus hyperantus TaxID=2795564 RepID=UPI0015691ADF|nr:23 kDa integral membrane protein-like [Maniola hyperantus]
MCLLSCGACLAQSILFVLNFLLSIVSLAVTGIGIFALIEVHKVSNEDLDFNSPAIIVIVVGAVFSAIFFCGCCGAFCKNRCLLITYSVITILLATATVVFTVVIFKDGDQIKETAEDVLTDTFSNPQNKETLGLMEATLGCCGTTGPDYYNSSIPVTCCPSALQNFQNLQDLQNIQQDNINITAITDTSSGSINLSCPASEAFQQGCVDALMALLSEIFKITRQVLIWVIIIEYAAAVLAILLSCYIGK